MNALPFGEETVHPEVHRLHDNVEGNPVRLSYFHVIDWPRPLYPQTLASMLHKSIYSSLPFLNDPVYRGPGRHLKNTYMYATKFTVSRCYRYSR